MSGHSAMTSGHRTDIGGHCTGLSLGLGSVTKRERSPSPSDCMSPDTINPASPADSSKNEFAKTQMQIKIYFIFNLL